MSGVRPRGWTVLGGGPMADAVRAEIERDPDRYAPETWSMVADGKCTCCGELVWRCTTRHTGWKPGFATYGNVVHPSMNPDTGLPDPDGTVSGCCCVAPNWGPKHDAQNEKPSRKRKRKTRG